MPRVHTRTAKTSTKDRRCTGCREPIEPGQIFYTWARRSGRSGMTYYKHTTCGQPRPTELSSRKTAVVEEAVNDAGKSISAWTPTFDDRSFDDVSSALEPVADEAEGVADEYEEGVDNMPEGFQQGPTGEAMTDVAERLREWADTLRSWEPDEEEPDLPESMEGESDEMVAEKWQPMLEEWAEGVRQSADDAMSEMPEYEG